MQSPCVRLHILHIGRRTGANAGRPILAEDFPMLSGDAPDNTVDIIEYEDPIEVEVRASLTCTSL